LSVTTLGEVAAAVEELAPSRLAETWDNVGLQVGNPAAPVRSVLAAVEVSPAVLEEAISRRADALVCHHPLLFEPLSRLSTEAPLVRLALALHDHNIGLVVAHTNLDNSPHGPSAKLSEQLGLIDAAPFPVAGRERLLKLVVFVPEEALLPVRDALAGAGAGVIGNYSHCSFRSAGTGTFLPLAGASPYVGRIGEVEEAAEYRLEMVLPESAQAAAVTALRATHPYEEVAYDLYALENAGPTRGPGRLGDLPDPQPLGAFADRLAALLDPHHLRLVGTRDHLVQRVAVMAGSGGDTVAQAAAAGADVLVTGDTKHHQAALAALLGLCLVDAGHHETEKSAPRTLADHLRAHFGAQLTVTLAERDQSPYAQP
jgi:dinuclear metal center YbgI/SA1388 family protein